MKRAHEVALEGLVAASRKYRAALDARDSVAMEEARDDRDYHAACAQKLARSWQMLEVTPMHVANRRRSAGYLNEEETQPYERGVSPPAVRPVYGAPSASTAMPEHLLQLGREYGLDRPKQYGLPEDEEDGISPAAKRNFRRLGYLLLHAQS